MKETKSKIKRKLSQIEPLTIQTYTHLHYRIHYAKLNTIDVMCCYNEEKPIKNANIKLQIKKVK